MEFGSSQAPGVTPVPFATELQSAFVIPRVGTLTAFAVNIANVNLPAGVHLRAVVRRSAACSGPFADTVLAVETAAGIEAPPFICLLTTGAVPVNPNDAISVEFMLVADIGTSLVGVSTVVQASAGIAIF
jgi:hypothetical protein